MYSRRYRPELLLNTCFAGWELWRSRIRTSYSVLSVLPNSWEHSGSICSAASNLYHSIHKLSSTVKLAFILLCGTEK